jgi:hypothetical protein
MRAELDEARQVLSETLHHFRQLDPQSAAQLDIEVRQFISSVRLCMVMFEEHAVELGILENAKSLLESVKGELNQPWIATAIVALDTAIHLWPDRG